MAIRREVRLSQEFLYLKQRDHKYETKRGKLKKAMDVGKSIPTELMNAAHEVHHDIELDRLENIYDVDDDNASIGLIELKTIITTSREPKSRLKQFSKEIKLCLPNFQSINAGTYRVDELVDACKKQHLQTLLWE